MMLGQRADQEAIDEINHELGLDKHLFYQYGLYMNDLLPISIHHTSANSPTYFHKPGKYKGGIALAMGSYEIAIKRPYLRRSYQSKKNVAEVLGESLPETAVLAASSNVMSWRLAMAATANAKPPLG